MDTQALYDLSPVLHVMLTGIAVAAGPLSWVWLRNLRGGPARQLRALTFLALFVTFDLVLFGAFTRLTDSGLGCPDWPGCYGEASPFGAASQISHAQAQMPTGPVTHTKAWIEMIHRYLATGVGVLIITLTYATWRSRRKGAAVSTAWPALTLLWICIQGAFGALTVTMKLQPIIVTLHLLGGIVLLALLVRQAVAYDRAREDAVPIALPAGLRAFVWAGFVLAWVQVALGGWVSTNYAVLACSEFPSCQGSFWPPMDLHQGFELWRSLGMTGAGEHISFAALTAIHYVHRLGAYLVFAFVGVLAWQLHREGSLRDAARWIAVLLLWQFATGLSNVVLDWPLFAAVSHTGGAAALIAVLTGCVCAARVQPVQAPELQPQGARA